MVSDHDHQSDNEHAYRNDNEQVFEEDEESNQKRVKYTPAQDIARGIVSLVEQKLVTESGATAMVALPSFLYCFSRINTHMYTSSANYMQTTCKGRSTEVV